MTNIDALLKPKYERHSAETQDLWLSTLPTIDCGLVAQVTDVYKDFFHLRGVFNFPSSNNYFLTGLARRDPAHAILHFRNEDPYSSQVGIYIGNAGFTPELPSVEEVKYLFEHPTTPLTETSFAAVIQVNNTLEESLSLTKKTSGYVTAPGITDRLFDALKEL